MRTDVPTSVVPTYHCSASSSAVYVTVYVPINAKVILRRAVGIILRRCTRKSHVKLNARAAETDDALVFVAFAETIRVAASGDVRLEHARIRSQCEFFGPVGNK